VAALDELSTVDRPVRCAGLGCADRRALLVATAVLSGILQAASIPPVVRAGHSAYLRTSSRELTVTVLKRDLNIYPAPDPVTVSLRDPLWREVASGTLPDDGRQQPGPAPEVQRLELRVRVPRPGVFTLAVAGPGGDFVWGVDTNAEGLVVEGEVVLNDAQVSGSLFFQPPDGAFKVEAQAFHAPGVQSLPLHDAAGKELHRFELDRAAGFRSCEVGGETGDRSGLWSFDIARMDVKMVLPGVRYWALDRAAFFVPVSGDGTLLPRFTARYLPAQAEVPVLLRFHGRKDARKGYVFLVDKEPRESPLDARVAAVHPAPYPGTSASQVAEVRITAGQGAWDGRETRFWVSVAEAGSTEPISTAEIQVRSGSPPALAPLSLPVVNRPHEHENVALGYVPDYTANEVYFDLQNRPVIRQRWVDRNWSPGVVLRRAGRWVESRYEDALRAAFPVYTSPVSGAGFLGCKVAFDGTGGMYTMLRPGLKDRSQKVALLFSPDEGRTWQAIGLPGAAFDIENFSGHNALPHPPPVLTYVATRPHPTARWGGYHELNLYLPRREGDRISAGEPILVSDRCLGSCQHSGAPPSLATRAGRTHIVWGEAVEEDVPGVPTYIATVDHATRTLGPKVFVGYAPPSNDVHNVPAVCLDSAGFVHVVTGAHGARFLYRRSRQPNRLDAGLTDAVPTLESGYVDQATDADGDGRQTYCSLVCDDRDTLHIAFRQWRQGVDPYHGGTNYGALSLQSKPKDQPWGPARVMVVPPLPGYSIYYHKLTVDRHGGLYLSYSYLSGEKSYQEQFPELYDFAALMLSKDHGATWKLAATADFPAGP